MVGSSIVLFGWGLSVGLSGGLSSTLFSPRNKYFFQKLLSPLFLSVLCLVDQPFSACFPCVSKLTNVEKAHPFLCLEAHKQNAPFCYTKFRPETGPRKQHGEVPSLRNACVLGQARKTHLSIFRTECSFLFFLHFSPTTFPVVLPLRPPSFGYVFPQ